ncbi:hypothetical protein [Longitalea arenae]|uniref:hypothetical protein n=1 Tax=Longitalea arenae TaxID=2812558 RepID=UPI001967788B|nr:hypothetical protein [Longitalea arenae]
MSTSTHRPVNSSKVAVVMPAANGHSYQNRHIQQREEKTTQTPPKTVAEPVVVETPPVAVQEAPEELPVVVPTPVVEMNGASQPVEKNGNGHHYESQKAENGWKFDPLREIPTLAHQQAVKELNEVMASKEASLNEKLKEEVKEVAHVLNDAPVRDLRRAIGINDRFVFISELFRNDEVMYERSIKTINSFRILPEAQYWIERELKVKLGWDENKESTRHFYQLVKRRFS